MVEILLESGCSVDDMAILGTPLFCACRSGQIEVSLFYFSFSFFFSPFSFLSGIFCIGRG